MVLNYKESIERLDTVQCSRSEIQHYKRAFLLLGGGKNVLSLF
jgi:hypothetical protein